MADQNDLLESAISLGGDKEATRSFYGEWADKYEKDMLEGTGYVAPRLVAEKLTELVSGTAEILDAGCGSGLAGQALRDLGKDLLIDGIDLTPEMLTVAHAKKGVYRDLVEADMTASLDMFETDMYDGVISAGVFTNGHVGPSGLDELIRITKPGAPIVITVRDSAWEADGFKDYFEKLKADGKVTIHSIEHRPYHVHEGVECELCTVIKV
ncbi:methyltransferase type 11 [Roseibium sp. TrichSKD4]|uniref:class I SAM-dependent DNA methyltransferase n=1 Tax=Roseibium sp. TrichSKD4 TaxID=744980 RepID=UPI0001E563B1|nr:methyltransferase domain-containing protein [Roseibium sp. TrichSKD4]EFO33043.1 methyltransferase type 11 [Roseibium sp. TrichSKD4]